MREHILCIDDTPEFLLGLKIQLRKHAQVSTASSLLEAWEILEREEIDGVLLDVTLGEDSGLEALRQIKSRYPQVNVVMISGHRDPHLIVASIRAGASDYLCKPFGEEDLLAVIEKIRKISGMQELNEALIEDINERDPEPLMSVIGQSKSFREVLSRAECVKGHSANVLIEGESGTGKEVLARFIHDQEGNSRRPFVVVNCAAIPENLLESELFGHERGAFSGAFRRKVGKFELANGGDIFLDEINSLKLDLQAKLLRALQEKEFYRVGGTSSLRMTFRVIAATNQNLDSMVTQGLFRMDLFHRLRVVSFRLPPLRERTDDIARLAHHFLEKHSPSGRPKLLTPEALVRLTHYSWPGNVRELENLIHSLIIMSANRQIDVSDLPIWLNESAVESRLASAGVPLPDAVGEALPLKRFVQSAERNYIERILRSKNGDKSKAAEVLRISRTSLYEKLRFPEGWN